MSLINEVSPFKEKRVYYRETEATYPYYDWFRSLNSE